MINEKAEWIWTEKDCFPGQIAEFTADFENTGGVVGLSLCCDTDYIAYVNGKRVSFLQFPNYPDVKYYDCIDISGACVAGVNTLKIIVRYEGENTATHIDSGAALIFSVECNGETVVFSNESVLSCDSGNYIQGVTRHITWQLGNAVDMCTGKSAEYHNSRVIDINPRLLERPLKKLTELPRKEALKISDNPCVFDLGCEDTGYLFVELNCLKPSFVTVSYGEHINDGCVRQKIGGRDFSINFDCSEGNNYFENFFVRLGGRYIQVNGDCEVVKIGIIPVIYPLTEKKTSLKGLDKQIYDTSVRTLRLCMHEHYEDCPWREQALYILDSRNQMKCGYRAFEESSFQKQNLLYMLNGQREDGMMDLTFPTYNSTNAIPFFSITYPVSICEYVDNTGDVGILEKTMPAIIRIFDFFVSLIDETCMIANPSYWNFYEWTDGNSDGKPGEHDLILNCAFINSYNHLKKLCKVSGYVYDFNIEKLKNSVVINLFNQDTGVFRNRIEGEETFSQMGNAFAVICGLGDDRTVSAVKECKNMVKASLSTQCFVYDALLAADKEKYREFVLDDIRRNYKYMLDNGATSFWETIAGEKDFNNAGSLCHGWSAMPVWYYSILM